MEGYFGFSGGGGGGSSPTPPAGSNTQIQYNDNGSFGASPNFTYNTSTGFVEITYSIATATLKLNGIVASTIFEIATDLFVSTSSGAMIFRPSGTEMARLTTSGLGVNSGGAALSTFVVVGNAYIGGNSAATAILQISGSTTGAASLNITPSASSPSSPNIGDVWYDTTANGMTLFNNNFSTNTFTWTDGTRKGAMATLGASSGKLEGVYIGSSSNHRLNLYSSNGAAALSISNISSRDITINPVNYGANAQLSVVSGSLSKTFAVRDVLDNDTMFSISSFGGIFVKEGTNLTMGIATLSGGTVVVNTNKVTANSRIFLTGQALGTVSVFSGYGISARVAGTSFTILASVPTDTSTVAWIIIEPN